MKSNKEKKMNEKKKSKIFIFLINYSFNNNS